MKMIRLLLILTFLCGICYPLTVTLISQMIFPEQSGGSLISRNGKLVGSELLAQKFSKDEFFHPRPSAGDYITIASGASQASPTQKAATNAWKERRNQNPLASVDAWTTSGSGLDPHISPTTAYAQVNRIASSRTMTSANIRALIDEHIEGPVLGIWGQPRVNVLKLNLALDVTRK